MKCVLLALVLFASNACAMTGGGTAADNPVVVRLKAPDANGGEQVVEFTYAQAMRLKFFATILPETQPAQLAPDPVFDPLIERWQESDNPGLHDLAAKITRNAHEVLERTKSVYASTARECASGITLPIPDAWYCAEILKLVHQATNNVLNEADAHTFVYTLTGDQACLVYDALDFFGFDGSLLAIIESDIAYCLLHEAEFFAQSLAPIKFEDLSNLPPCAFSAFLIRSRLMYKTLLPIHVLRPELIIDEPIPGYLRGASKDGAYVCCDVDHESCIYATRQNMRLIGSVPGVYQAFSADGKKILIQSTVDDTNTLYVTHNLHELGTVHGTAIFSPCGQFLAVHQSGNNTVTLHSTQDCHQIGSPVQAPARQFDSKFPYEGITFSPDGRFLSITSEQEPQTTSLYDTQDMHRIGNATPGTCVGFSPNSERILIIKNMQLTIYETGFMQPVTTPVPGYYAVFNSDSRLLWVESEHHSAHGATTYKTTLYNTENMHAIGDPIPGIIVEISSDCQRLAARYFFPSGHSEMRIYNAQTMVPVNNAPLFGVPQFSHDGQFVIAGSKIYRAQDMHCIGQDVGEGFFKDSVDGQLIAMDTGLYTVLGARKLNSFGRAWNKPVFLAPANSDDVLAIWQDDSRHDAYITRCGCINSAQHMAVLVAMHRQNATGDVARLLDEKSEWWAQILIDAPTKVWNFVGAQFPKTLGKCCAQ